jgi:hypothetical protein
MREYKLVSLLLKIQNANNLESIFLDILCQAYINDRESLAKMKELLNKYFTMIIDISNHADQKEEKSFNLFEDFYFKFFNKGNQIKWNLSGVMVNHRISNIHLVISGYYFLEEQLKNILSENSKYEFYFNCYTFIYPTLANLDYMSFSGANKEGTGVQKIEEFLINMLRSCIEVDIDLGLSFYSTIKENFQKLGSLKNVVGIFVDYCVKSHDWSGFINKLYFAERELVKEICLSLESKCESVTSDNNNMFYLLKSSLKLSGDHLISNFNNPYISEGYCNFFIILSAIYIELGDLQKAAQISFAYSEGVNKQIEAHLWNISDLKKLYQERRKAISVVLHCIEHIEGISTSPLFVIKDDQEAPSANLKFVTKMDLENWNVLNKIRMQILDKLEVDINKVHANYQVEQLNKIKNPNVMMNYMFNMNLLNIILDEHLVSRNLFDDLTTRKLIINFIRVLFSHGITLDQMQIDDQMDNRLPANALGSVKYFNPNDIRLISFYEQIILSGKTSSVFTALETILFLNRNYELPQILVKEAKTKNSERLMELFIKYSRSDVNFIIILIKFVLF